MSSTIRAQIVVSLTETAQRQAVLANIPASSRQILELDIPAHYLEVCAVDATGKVVIKDLERLQTNYVFGSIPGFNVRSAAELTAGALLMQNWKTRVDKVARVNLEYLKKFADAFVQAAPELEAAIVKGIADLDKNARITAQTLINQTHYRNSLHFSEVAEVWIRKEFIAGSRTKHYDFTQLVDSLTPALKDEAWFVEFIQKLSEYQKKYAQGQARITQELSKKTALAEESKRKASFEREQRIEAGEQALLAWAKEYGSEKLKLMLELDAGDVVAQTESEFIENHVPVGFSREAYRNYQTTEQRKHPTLPELSALKQMIALQEGNQKLYAEAHLVWADYELENGTTYSQAALQVKVKTPTLKSAWIAMPFPATKIEAKD